MLRFFLLYGWTAQLSGDQNSLTSYLRVSFLYMRLFNWFLNCSAKLSITALTLVTNGSRYVSFLNLNLFYSFLSCWKKLKLLRRQRNVQRNVIWGWSIINSISFLKNRKDTFKRLPLLCFCSKRRLATIYHVHTSVSQSNCRIRDTMLVDFY